MILSWVRNLGSSRLSNRPSYSTYNCPPPSKMHSPFRKGVLKAVKDGCSFFARNTYKRIVFLWVLYSRLISFFLSPKSQHNLSLQLLCRYLGLVSEWLFAWAPMPLGDSKYVFTSLQPFYRPFPRS